MRQQLDHPQNALEIQHGKCGKAVRIEVNGPVFVDQPVPMATANNVVVRVEALGLCRTDLRVFDGTIAVSEGRIPGHEFAGVVTDLGDAVTRVTVGDHVVVNPVLPCRTCEHCASSPSLCQHTQFLGLDVDGACADFVTVPEGAVYSIPDDLPAAVAAFAEPVAASLAVLNADIQPSQRGVLLGSNRIAELTHRILLAHGFDNIVRCSEVTVAELPSHTFDFAIETLATTAAIAELIRGLKPQGCLVLKSRQQRPIELTIADLLPKQLRIECVNYGSFDEAIDLLSSGKISVTDLTGEHFNLTDYAAAFENAQRDEQVKTFIVPDLAGESVGESS